MDRGVLASSHSTGDDIPGRHPDFCEDQGRAPAGTRGSLAPTGESRAMSPREEVLILVPEVVYLGHKIYTKTASEILKGGIFAQQGGAVPPENSLERTLAKHWKEYTVDC